MIKTNTGTKFEHTEKKFKRVPTICLKKPQVKIIFFSKIFYKFCSFSKAIFSKALFVGFNFI